MTKKPAHLNAEPKELGPEPADLTGKELEPVRDWDAFELAQLAAAIRDGQTDIIEAELDWLQRVPAWSRQAPKVFAHAIVAPADLVADALAKCRLDNIPVTYQQPWPLLPRVDDESGF